MSNNRESDLRRKLLLLQGGMHYQEIPREFTVTQIKRLNLEEKQRDTSGKGVSFPGEHHLWGYDEYQDYNYLGPGTQYKKRQALGIEPINDLDRIAMYHDAGYDSYTGGSGGRRALTRAYHDIGAGSAMITAGLNPWSDAPLAMSVLAGVGLVGQGFLRIHPVTALPMAIADWLLYGPNTTDPALGDARKWLYA